MASPTADAPRSDGALLLASGCALVVALPLFLRSPPSPAALAYLAAAGGAAILLGPLMAASRALRPWPPRLTVAVGALLAAAGPLVLLGAALKEKTHHRPLGGATFAVVAAVVMAVAVVGALRLVDIARASPRRRLWFGAGWAVVALSLGACLIGFAPLLTGEGRLPGAGAVLVDLVLVAAVVAVTRASPRSIPLRASRAGAALWILLVAAGCLVLGRDAALAEELGMSSPLFSLTAWLVAP